MLPLKACNAWRYFTMSDTRQVPVDHSAPALFATV
jgi:hypothetical protein